MEITLEKIDIIRSRTGIGYREAKDALVKNNGDVVETLVYLEESGESWTDNIGKNLTNTTDAVMEKLKETIKKGNVTKVIVKRDGKIIMNIPVTAGAIGAILFPPATAVALTAAVISKCTIEIIKENGEIININEMTEKTMDRMKNVVKKDNTTNKESDE